MNLVYSKEAPLFALSLVISVVFWLGLLVGTLGTALIWVGIFFLIYLFAQSAFISHIRGTAVHITRQQFPDLYERIGACAAKLGMKEIPDAYLLHGNGVFNAFATRFLGRNFIVLFSDVVDALDECPEAVNFYIGHELGHILRKHLVWGPLLAPASFLPLLGAAYSRAREYTSDRHGLACCGQAEDARRGLAALAAGGKRWKTLNDDSYIDQAQSSSGFWMSFHELVASYPWLVKRMAALRTLAGGQAWNAPKRNPFAYFFALFVPRLGVGAGVAPLFLGVAMVGILGAVAIPTYQDYVQRAKVAAALGRVGTARTAVVDYVIKNRAWPDTNAQAGVPETGYGPDIRRVEIEHGGVVVADIAGGEVVLTPHLKDRHIFWQCSTRGLAVKYLPRACR